MKRHFRAEKPPVRYSEAFKMAVVREVEEEGKPFDAVRHKYGIGGYSTVQRWVRRYGNGTRGKVTIVQKPNEIDERKRLAARVRVLEAALADAHVELALERAYVNIACRRAGIADVAEFKKKTDGTRAMKP